MVWQGFGENARVKLFVGHVRSKGRWRVDLERRAEFEQISESFHLFVGHAEVGELGTKLALDDQFDLLRIIDQSLSCLLRHGSQDGGVANEQLDGAQGQLVQVSLKDVFTAVQLKIVAANALKNLLKFTDIQRASHGLRVVEVLLMHGEDDGQNANRTLI